ncbi:MAG: DUF2817 domain-containing protein [Oligoflexia bacterium]|nr:DUF2817 domain-containing protein [Oligoflexia bacterium]
MFSQLRSPGGSPSLFSLVVIVGFFLWSFVWAHGGQVSDEEMNACTEQLNQIPGLIDLNQLKQVCQQARLRSECKSVLKAPIFHWDYGKGLVHASRKILVMGLIHGDEPTSGTLARLWLLRLTRIQPRNAWRMIVVSNPDGFRNKTRVNARGVDLNRNFPTQDWPELAIEAWEKTTQKNPRRFPGSAPGSEPETQCILAQIEDFKPDLIVSIHSPYGLVDFDGPKGVQPRLAKLPSKSIGSFPGSLGRLMWKDRSIPVVTIELTPGSSLPAWLQDEQLQDVLGDFSKKLPTVEATR